MSERNESQVKVCEEHYDCGDCAAYLKAHDAALLAKAKMDFDLQLELLESLANRLRLVLSEMNARLASLRSAVAPTRKENDDAGRC